MKLYNTPYIICGVQSSFKTQPNIEGEGFCKNTSWPLAVKCFCLFIIIVSNIIIKLLIIIC